MKKIEREEERLWGEKEIPIIFARKHFSNYYL